MADKQYTIRVFTKTVYVASLLDGEKYVNSTGNRDSHDEAVQVAIRQLSDLSRTVQAGDTVSVVVEDYAPGPDI